MQSPFKFIITPVGGKYSTTKELENGELIYLTASIEHAVDVNRLAKVVNVPKLYNGAIKAGDTIIIHHNTFRDFYNTTGKVISSGSHLMDDLFVIGEELIYLYKGTEDEDWTPNDYYCFIKPFKKLDYLSNTEQLATREGIVVYSNHLEIGKRIGFTPESEYEFEINGEILYRMTTRDICLCED